jgi:threonine dehydratase
MTVTIADIHAAARLMEGAVVRTPSVASPRLSELTGAHVVLKLENFQHTGSFKDRGALVKLASLGPRTVKGVVAASAGNHAQGVAHHPRFPPRTTRTWRSAHRITAKAATMPLRTSGPLWISGP